MSPRSLTDELERLVDETTLGSVLDALAEVAFEKAEHVSASYSDEPLARLWRRASRQLARLSEEVEV
jgi:hypothetical protein